MAKLRPLPAREVLALLAAHGFQQVRQRGSHIAMQRHDGHSTVTVIVPNHKEILIGTLASIIRQSRLPRAIFEP